MQLSEAADWATILAAVGAPFALLAALAQVRATRREAFANRRPYVITRYLRKKVSGKPDRIELKIMNCGKTPAYGVSLEFAKDSVWHWVSKPTYPFLGNGLAVLEPGESVEYFVGNLTATSDLSALLQTSVSGIIRYRAHPKSGRMKLADPLEISLKQFTYQSRK